MKQGINFEAPGNDTVDGSEIRLSPVEVGSLFRYLQACLHRRWLFGISSINSSEYTLTKELFTALSHKEIEPWLKDINRQSSTCLTGKSTNLYVHDFVIKV